MSDNWLNGSNGPLRFQIIPSGCISCNAVVLWNENSGEAVVIDPTDDATNVIAFVTDRGLGARQILLTHAHFDHAADAERAMTTLGASASLHADDLPLYLEIPFHAPKYGLNVPARTLALTQVRDRQIITALTGCEIQVLHVPGHSPGSVTFYVPQAGWAFVGDTLFNSGVGRTDLPGGSTKKLVASIQTRLYVLPDDTLAICGHGTTTTIGREKRFNRFVREAPVESTP
jgi:hydroxyacylglutathione hydrolase